MTGLGRALLCVRRGLFPLALDRQIHIAARCASGPVGGRAGYTRDRTRLGGVSLRGGTGMVVMVAVVRRAKGLHVLLDLGEGRLGAREVPRLEGRSERADICAERIRGGFRLPRLACRGHGGIRAQLLQGLKSLLRPTQIAGLKGRRQALEVLLPLLSWILLGGWGKLIRIGARRDAGDGHICCLLPRGSSFYLQEPPGCGWRLPPPSGGIGRSRVSPALRIDNKCNDRLYEADEGSARYPLSPCRQDSDLHSSVAGLSGHWIVREARFVFPETPGR